MSNEYPRMMYKDGSLAEHQLQEKELKVYNKFAVETRLVNSHDDEQAAVADGWRYSADPAAPLPEHVARAEADRAKDEEIARLKAQVAAAEKPKLGLKAEATS